MSRDPCHVTCTDQVDPSGSYWAWKASAIGKNATNAKTFLEKRYNPEVSVCNMLVQAGCMCEMEWNLYAIRCCMTRVHMLMFLDSHSHAPSTLAQMELEDAINTAILTLKEGFEGAISEENIEIGVIGVDRKFRILSAQEVKVSGCSHKRCSTHQPCRCACGCACGMCMCALCGTMRVDCIHVNAWMLMCCHVCHIPYVGLRQGSRIIVVVLL